MLNHPKIDDDISQIDEVNLKIINILKNDSSTPFVDIAKRIGVSDATVHQRIRRMIASRHYQQIYNLCR